MNIYPHNFPTSEVTLVTGGTGFLGRHVLNELKHDAGAIVCLTRSQAQEPKIDGVLYVSVDEYFEAYSLLNVKQVIHLATNYGRKETNPIEVIEANVILPIRILNNHLGSLKRFINIDSYFTKTPVLQEYLWQYSLSKRQAVDWLERLSKGIELHNVSLEHIFGPGDSPEKFAAWLLGTLRRGDPVQLTSGSQLRDWIYVKDAARAISLLALSPFDHNPSGPFAHELGTGETFTVREFAEVMARAVDSKSDILLGAVPDRVDEIPASFANNESLRALGWAPAYSLENAIREYVEGP